MNSKSKQRRVINLNKDDFDEIKSYCDENALNMTKWIVKILKKNMELKPDEHIKVPEYISLSEGWNPDKPNE